MAHKALRIQGLRKDISNPYDPSNMDTDVPFGMKDASGTVIGKRSIASLLPGETSTHYLTYDCHRRIKECDLKGDNYECVSCRSLGGGNCVKASAKLKTDAKIQSDGVCVPLNDKHQLLAEAVNPFTTIEEAYLHNEEEETMTGSVAYLTRKMGCIDASLVRKDPAIISQKPQLEPIIGCTDIIMCGGRGVGAPLHPVTKYPIESVEDIDFDISDMASSMTCYCEAGYTADRDPISGVPFCKITEGGVPQKEIGMGCPVVFYTGNSKGCLCDDSIQVRLEEILEVRLDDTGSDYEKSYADAARNLSVILERYENLRMYTTKDACLPKPGVDPRMSATGYSYATSLFGLAPEITAFNGGHLMTGGLLRESAMDADGNWHSRIEDNEEGKLVVSESVGGVVPYAGTGSVAAHVWNGDRLNDNGLIGAGGGKFTKHPNASMRVVPLPHSNLPGFGIDSMDHAVGIVASKGRVYPECVYGRKGASSNHPDKDRRGAKKDDEDGSYLLDSTVKDYDFYKDSPLARLRTTHDSGICATAYVIPSVHRAIQEKPDANADDIANKIVPLMHYRPLAKRAAHTPIEAILRSSIISASSRDGIIKGQLCYEGSIASQFSQLSVVAGKFDTLAQLLMDYHFPGLNGDGREKTGGIKARDVFSMRNNEELKEIGGLLIQPVTIEGEGFSSTFSRFGEKILSTNSPKIIDHYKVGPTAHKHTVEENQAKHLFPAPPTAWRIVSNEGTFFSGRGLNNGVVGTGMRNAEKDASKFSDGRKPEAFSAVVMSGDGVLMHGESAPTLRPMEIPACSLPENTWFERRDSVNARGNAGDATTLKLLNNAYSSVTSGNIHSILNATTDIKTSFNTYAPAKPYYKHYDPPETHIDFWLGLAGPTIPIIGPAFFGFTDKSILAMEYRKTGTAGSLHHIVPLKFHVEDDLWQQCKVTVDGGAKVIPPTMALFESELRLRTLSSEGFVRPEILPHRFRGDWGLSPHTAGHYMYGIYSPPCIREETGQAYGYPCSGALSQYLTMLVPKTTGANSHSSYTKQTLKKIINQKMKEIPNSVGEILPANNQGPDIVMENIFDKIGALAKDEKCNCTCGLFCPKNHAGGRSEVAPIAAVPSRGNRHSRFALMTCLPRNDIHLVTALLRAQTGDKAILNEIGRIRGNGKRAKLKAVVENGWGLETQAILAPNRWAAFRRNIAYTPYSTRVAQNLAGTLTEKLHENTPAKFDRKADIMGKNGLADLIDKNTVLEDSDTLAGVPPSDSEILNFIKNAASPGQEGARARRILDFFESATGSSPSTFNVGSFCPHAEGPKDVVAVYATPVLTSVSTPAATINEGLSKQTIMITQSSLSGDLSYGNKRLKRKIEEEVDKFTPSSLLFNSSDYYVSEAVTLYEASKNIPRIMRRIHLLPVNITYHGGFESGQTAAGAACSRGVELIYRDFIKPAIVAEDGGVTTSLEGVRLKAPEPFDDLSVRGYFSTDAYSLKKFAHHHHYGYEGLMSRNFYGRERSKTVPEGELKDRFPFVCQSDRGTFPPMRDGTMQVLALVEMGIMSDKATGRTITQE